MKIAFVSLAFLAMFLANYVACGELEQTTVFVRFPTGEGEECDERVNYSVPKNVDGKDYLKSILEFAYSWGGWGGYSCRDDRSAASCLYDLPESENSLDELLKAEKFNRWAGGRLVRALKHYKSVRRAAMAEIQGKFEYLDAGVGVVPPFEKPPKIWKEYISVHSVLIDLLKQQFSLKITEEHC